MNLFLMKSKKNFFTLNIYILLIMMSLPIMFIADGFSKYLTVQGNDFSRISLLVRLVFEISILSYLFIYIKKEKFIYLSALALLFVFFVIGQSLIDNFDNFLENFIQFNKYIFLFLVFLFFSKIFELNEYRKLLIYRIMTFLIILTIASIFTGFIFELDFFKSFYEADYRFGYNGVFLAGNESSFVLICMLSFLYFRAYYEKRSKIFLLILILASLLSGMKAVYLFILLLSLFHIINKMKKYHFIWIIPLSIYVTKYIIEYFQSEEFQLLIAFFVKTLEEKGFFYMMLSGRQEFIALKFLPSIEDWSLLNFIVGGQNFPKYLIEMDFLDLILFFGGFGSMIYIYFFYKVFIQKLLWHKFFTFFIFSILILAFFGGHFLTSPTTAVYLSLVIIYFQNYRLKQYAKNSTHQ